MATRATPGEDNLTSEDCSASLTLPNCRQEWASKQTSWAEPPNEGKLAAADKSTRETAVETRKGQILGTTKTRQQEPLQRRAKEAKPTPLLPRGRNTGRAECAAAVVTKTRNRKGHTQEQRKASLRDDCSGSRTQGVGTTRHRESCVTALNPPLARG